MMKWLLKKRACIFVSCDEVLSVTDHWRAKVEKGDESRIVDLIASVIFRRRVSYLNIGE